MNAESQPPQGIGGWLILPVLGLVVAPFYVGYLLVTNYLPLFFDGRWRLLTTPGTSFYHHLWAPIITLEVIGNLASIALAVTSLVFLLRRSKKTPLLVIACYAWGAIFAVLDHVLVGAIPAAAAGLADPQVWVHIAQRIGAAAIWIPYFLLSKRVRATFVR
jgi:hypothetical protein